jgi:thiol-disulfide isomerase/thioredoxin
MPGVERLEASAFHGTRLDRPGRTTVAFVAAWCPFCREFLPRYQAREGTVPGTLATVDLSEEENPLWERFHIDVVPTLIGFESGSERWRVDGILGRGMDPPMLEAALRRWGAPTR